MERFLVHPGDLPLFASVLRRIPAPERFAKAREILDRTQAGWELYKLNGKRPEPGHPHQLMSTLLNMPLSDRGLEAHQDPEFLACLALAAVSVANWLAGEAEGQEEALARLAAE